MDMTSLPPPPPPPAAPSPPAAESDATSAAAVTPPQLLPYAVAVVSVAVLGAVAWLLFAQPRRARMSIDEVIVLDGPAPAPATTAATAVPAAAEQPSSAALDSSRPPAAPPAPAPTAAATPAMPDTPAPEPAPGDILEAELTGEGSSGDGFVQIGGLTVYVAGGRKGERVRFRIREVKTSRKGNRYAQAERCTPAEGGVP